MALGLEDPCCGRRSHAAQTSRNEKPCVGSFLYEYFGAGSGLSGLRVEGFETWVLDAFGLFPNHFLKFPYFGVLLQIRML